MYLCKYYKMHSEKYPQRCELLTLLTVFTLFTLLSLLIHRLNSGRYAHMYDSIATVGEIRVYWRADFQSGSRVLKKVC